MKKRRLKHKEPKMKGLISIFLITLFTVGVGYSLLSENLQVKGTATLVKQTNSELNIDMSYTKNIWGNNPYTIQYNVIIKNKTREITNGWIIYIDVPSGTEVLNCWNVKCSIKNEKLILQNLDYNSNISIDGQLSFGIQLNTLDSNLELNKPYFEEIEEQNEEQIVSDGLEVNYKQTQSWKDNLGYHIHYDVTVKNNSSDIIKKWRVEIEKDNTAILESAWNSDYIEQKSCIIFTNKSHNGRLEPFSSATFGFIINVTNRDVKLSTRKTLATK